MANVSPIILTFKPAYYALLQCAQAVAEKEGHDVAIRWADGVLAANFELFCGIEPERPRLRLIVGGR